MVLVLERCMEASNENPSLPCKISRLEEHIEDRILELGEQRQRSVSRQAQRTQRQSLARVVHFLSEFRVKISRGLDEKREREMYPTEVHKMLGTSVEFNGFAEIATLDLLRHLLQGGLQAHFECNPLVQDMIGMDESVRAHMRNVVNQSEHEGRGLGKYDIVDVSSPLAKERAKKLKKEKRDKVTDKSIVFSENRKKAKFKSKSDESGDES